MLNVKHESKSEKKKTILTSDVRLYELKERSEHKLEVSLPASSES